jgi:hypothetical protein
MKTRGWKMADGGWTVRSLGGRAGSAQPAAARWGHRALPAVWLLLLTLHPPLSTCFAQSYSIDWYKIAGGGGTSTNSPYAVTGTIGQHDAGGPLTGGNFALTGGFWALLSVVQTPGVPPLFISRSGNSATVYWQAVAGWNLQQNSDLTAPAGWSASGGVTSANGTNYLSVSPLAGNLFFRLGKP